MRFLFRLRRVHQSSCDSLTCARRRCVWGRTRATSKATKNERSAGRASGVATINVRINKRQSGSRCGFGAQLKEVLLRDPGLLVELKRLIAKEASNNGQVIVDEDLTDNAVYQRLVDDVKFRSIATRLVQRYGYLRPSVNPDSDLGKQQDLVLKERARRMVQIEAQEDQRALQAEPTERRSQNINTSCRGGNYDQNNPEDSECEEMEWPVGEATKVPRELLPLKMSSSNPRRQDRDSLRIQTPPCCERRPGDWN